MKHLMFIAVFILSFLLLVIPTTLWVRESFGRSLEHLNLRSAVHYRSAKREIIFVWATYLALIFGLCFALEKTGGSPVFGLPLLFFGPFFCRHVLAYRKRKRQREMEGAALSFFYALQGLIQVGISLPAALFQLAAAQAPDSADSAAFRRAFHLQLSRFEAGRPLVECLGKFRSGGDWEHAGVLLVMIEIAYRNGLPLAGLLDRVLPVMEQEEQSFLRMRELRLSAISQAALALLLPWLLEGALYYFQPQLVSDFFHEPFAGALVAGVSAMEVAGAWIIWRLAVFY